MKRIVILLLLLLIVACAPSENQYYNHDLKKEILVYSSTIMSDAAEAVKKILESETDCRAVMAYGSSSYLKKMIEANRIGDIYISDSESYIKELFRTGTLGRVVLAGSNRLSFLIKKDHSETLSNSVEQLVNKKLNIAISTDESVTLGQETRKFLELNNIYEKAFQNAAIRASDSEDIAEAVRKGEADISLNWRAAGFSEINKNVTEIIEIDSEYIKNVPAAAGILRYSVESECSEKYMDILESGSGEDILKKYGFKNEN